MSERRVTRPEDGHGGLDLAIVHLVAQLGAGGRPGVGVQEADAGLEEGAGRAFREIVLREAAWMGAGGLLLRVGPAVAVGIAAGPVVAGAGRVVQPPEVLPVVAEPVAVAVAERPPDRGGRVGAELRVVPGLGPVAEGRIEHAAGAVLARPGQREVGRLELRELRLRHRARGFRCRRIEVHEDVQITARERVDRRGAGTPEQVELLGERERVAEALHRHVARILDADRARQVLAAVVDEAGADEVAVLRPRVEAVGAAVEADEALAAGDEGEQRLRSGASAERSPQVKKTTAS